MPATTLHVSKDSGKSFAQVFHRIFAVRLATPSRPSAQLLALLRLAPAKEGSSHGGRRRCGRRGRSDKSSVFRLASIEERISTAQYVAAGTAATGNRGNWRYTCGRAEISSSGRSGAHPSFWSIRRGRRYWTALLPAALSADGLSGLGAGQGANGNGAGAAALSVHALEDELRNESAILLLRVTKERQGAVVELHDDLTSISGHQHLQGAQVQPTCC